MASASVDHGRLRSAPGLAVRDSSARRHNGGSDRAKPRSRRHPCAKTSKSALHRSVGTGRWLRPARSLADRAIGLPRSQARLPAILQPAQGYAPLALKDYSGRRATRSTNSNQDDVRHRLADISIEGDERAVAGVTDSMSDAAPNLAVAIPQAIRSTAAVAARLANQASTEEDCMRALKTARNNKRQGLLFGTSLKIHPRQPSHRTGRGLLRGKTCPRAKWREHQV